MACPLRTFAAADADPAALRDQQIGVLGYGNLGRAVALNLRDSGLQPVVGNIEDDCARRAGDDGFAVLPLAEAARRSDVALLLLSDEVVPECFVAEVAPYLRPGTAVVFASGYPLAYGLVRPAAEVDVLLSALRMAGQGVRDRYREGRGFFSYISVEQDYSGRAWARLLGLALAVGSLRSGAMEVSARLEAELDLYIEQTLGATIGTALLTAFLVGEQAGLPPEALVMEMYLSGEMETVWRGFREEGFFQSSAAHGATAVFGAFRRTMELMADKLPERFAATLEEIRSGQFAQQFQAEREASYPTLAQARIMLHGDSALGRAEQRMRALWKNGKK